MRMECEWQESVVVGCGTSSCSWAWLWPGMARCPDVCGRTLLGVVMSRWRMWLGRPTSPGQVPAKCSCCPARPHAAMWPGVVAWTWSHVGARGRGVARVWKGACHLQAKRIHTWDANSLMQSPTDRREWTVVRKRLFHRSGDSERGHVTLNWHNKHVCPTIAEDSQPIEDVKKILKMSNKYVHLPENIPCSRKATDLNGSLSEVDDHRIKRSRGTIVPEWHMGKLPFTCHQQQMVHASLHKSKQSTPFL